MPDMITPVFSMKGTVSVPGDTRLTAMLMAYGAISESRLIIENFPKDPGLQAFAESLNVLGCNISVDSDALTMVGKALPSEIIISRDIHDTVVHIITSGAAVTGSRVIVPREILGGYLYDRITGGLLAEIGIKCSIDTDENAIIISDAEFDPSETITIDSVWKMEALLACVAVTGKDVVVVSKPDNMSFPGKVASVFGIDMLPVTDPVQAHDFEITRRLARANGEQAPELVQYMKRSLPVERIRVPGDTRIAAAVCGLASCLQRSGVTVTNVLCESGRRGFIDSLRRMKGSVSTSSRTGRNHFDAADITVTWNALEHIDISPRQAQAQSGELLILAAVATCATGETVINDIIDGRGIGREACRICARGFEKLGVDVGDYKDGIVLRGCKELKGGTVETGGYDSVALALALASLTASGNVTLTDTDGDNYLLKSFLRLVKDCAGL